MKAVQLDGPGPPEALHIRELPLPVPPHGWVRIRVAAFGLNRSELHLRLGFATNATFPLVPVSNEWSIRDFYPIDYIPNGVRLTAYGGEASDLPREVLQRYLDDVAAGRVAIAIHRVFAMEEIVEAHRMMERNAAVGKLVVRVKG
jgi:NADPH:quinone reductase-like Zn-dependent oxidoreductase